MGDQNVHLWSDTPTHYSLPLEMLMRDVVNHVDGDRPTFVVSATVESIALPDTLLDERWRVLYHGRTVNEQRLYATCDEAQIAIFQNRAAAELIIYVTSQTSHLHASELLATISGRAPAPPAPPVDNVAIRFWSLSDRGPVSRRRLLTAGSWLEVRDNYDGKAQIAFDQIMGWDVAPPGGGRLVLLHGPPGTGKTHAIRALARQWKNWCRVHYVVDPDNFFGSASYMLAVLFDSQDGVADLDDDDDEHPGAPWRLIVVEDADELITQDAKRRTGQGMARLLNVCDGLVGQGLNVMILITTNEPVTALHKAITRPGRCLANIDVNKLSAAEAGAWLTRAGHPPAKPVGDKTVAELFELVRTQSQVLTSDGASPAPAGYL